MPTANDSWWRHTNQLRQAAARERFMPTASDSCWKHTIYANRQRQLVEAYLEAKIKRLKVFSACTRYHTVAAAKFAVKCLAK